MENPEMISEMVKETAREMGREAFHRGEKSGPMQNVNFVKFATPFAGTIEEGFLTILMREWSTAWHKENAKIQKIS